MVSAVMKALDRSQSVVSAAYADTLQKKEPSLGGLVSLGNDGPFDRMNTSSKLKRRYSLFRGWLYSGIHAIASQAAGQPVKMARLENSKEKSSPKKFTKKAYLESTMTSTIADKSSGIGMDVISAHPMLSSLARPNNIQYKWQFTYNFVTNLCITGWSYIIWNETETGEIEFFSLPTHWIRPNKDFTKFKLIDPKKPSSQGIDIDGSQVAFAQIPDPSDLLSALSPTESQITAVEIDDNIQTSQRHFFHNGIFPGAVVTIGKNAYQDSSGVDRPRLSASQRRQIQSLVKRQMAGVQNYGEPAIIDGLIEKIERYTATQTEMGWEKSEQAVRTRILSSIGVHPFVMGEPANVGGYAQAYNILEIFYARVNTFLDMLSTVMTELVNRIESAGGEDSNLLVWWQKNEAKDPSLRSKEIIFGFTKGAVTGDEYRLHIGLPPNENERGVRSVLLDSAAGMQGLTQIIKLVNEGVYDREAAANALALFLQISFEEAQSIIGTGEGKTVEDSIDAIGKALKKLDSPVQIDMSLFEKVLKDVTYAD